MHSTSSWEPGQCFMDVLSQSVREISPALMQHFTKFVLSCLAKYLFDVTCFHLLLLQRNNSHLPCFPQITLTSVHLTSTSTSCASLQHIFSKACLESPQFWLEWCLCRESWRAQAGFGISLHGKSQGWDPEQKSGPEFGLGFIAQQLGAQRVSSWLSSQNTPANRAKLSW